MAVQELLRLENSSNESIELASVVHKQQMFDLFASYCILDLLAMVEGIPGLIAILKSIKQKDLGDLANRVHFENSMKEIFDFLLKGWHHIVNWKTLLHKFQLAVENIL